MKTLNILWTSLLFLCFSQLYSQETASLSGCVTDLKNGETIPFADVVLFDAEGKIITGGSTDFDGNYNINPIAPGEYSLRASFIGKEPVELDNFLILAGENSLDIQFEDSGNIACCFCCCVIVYHPDEEYLDSTWTGPIEDMSTPETSDAEVAAYPNPTSGVLHIEAPSGIRSITLRDMSGKLLLETSAAESLDLSAFAPGHYLLQLLSAEGSESIRILKQ